MSRVCELTGHGVQFGNKVSHSNRKTRKKFKPNLLSVSLQSEVLNSALSLRITAKTLRTVESKGGLDAFLLSASASKLTDNGLKLRARIQKAIEKQQETA